MTTFKELIPIRQLPDNCRAPLPGFLQFQQNLINDLTKPQIVTKPKIRAKTITLNKGDLEKLLKDFGNDLIERLFERKSGVLVCVDCGKPAFVEPFSQEVTVKDAIREVIYERGL